jgi:hypothetical protein
VDTPKVDELALGGVGVQLREHGGGIAAHDDTDGRLAVISAASAVICAVSMMGARWSLL